jgi:hypothetical protein
MKLAMKPARPINELVKGLCHKIYGEALDDKVRYIIACK